MASALRGGGRESGQGRWDEVWIEGLSFRELLRLVPPGTVPEDGPADPRLFEVYLAVGGFPEHVLSDDHREVRQRLRRDVVERALLRDLAPRVDQIERLCDLFVYLVQDSGAMFTAASRAQDLGMDPRTVDGWIDLLEETSLVVRLPNWRPTNKASARLRQPSSRIYAADHGLVNAFAETAGVAGGERVRARSFEAAAFRQLREWQREHGGTLGFYRYRDRHEIDFVWWRGEERVAIEVTSSRRVSRDKIDKLTAAAARAGIERPILLHDALTRGEEGAVRHAPLADFLLSPGTFLEER